MSHVTDDLELYVLGALAPSDRARLEAHLGECPSCAREVEPLQQVMARLLEELPPLEPPAALRARILRTAETAKPVVAATPRVRWRWTLVPGLAAASVILAVVAAASLLQVDAMRADLAESRQIAERVSQPGDSWHMSGVDRWSGADARLFAPESGRAFVVFRGLEAAPAGQSYAIWLVDPDGRWIRGTSFNTDGGTTLVDVGVPVKGFDRCAVTLESGTEGKRSGPLVMQSRFYN